MSVCVYNILFVVVLTLDAYTCSVAVLRISSLTLSYLRYSRYFYKCMYVHAFFVSFFLLTYKLFAVKENIKVTREGV